MKNPFGYGVTDHMNYIRDILKNGFTPTYTMSPPGIEKMKKKELRKAFSDQWRQNMILRGENEKLKNDSDHDIHIRFQEMGQEIIDLREALSRRRQLYTSMEELVNRKQPKSIEGMAIALRNHEREICQELGIAGKFEHLEYSELPEEIRDMFMECLMKIIS